MQALANAFARWPVTVAEGDPNTGDHRATVRNHQEVESNNTQLCGDTNINTISVTDSDVDYINNMENAQVALNIVITNAQQRDQVIAQSVDLWLAIGRGLGTNAAHEIAHHFLFRCCDMDADPNVDLNARGTCNATGCNANADPSFWTGYWRTPEIILHWETNSSESVDAQRGLQQCLGKGWGDLSNSVCHN